MKKLILFMTAIAVMMMLVGCPNETSGFGAMKSTNTENSSNGGVNVTNVIGVIWKGSLVSHPSNPETGWAYYNTADKKSYIFDGSAWQIMAQDGTNAQSSGNGSATDSSDDGIIHGNIYMGESDETIDGVVYKVKSYAEVHAGCPYIFDFYKLYYLNDKVRRIQCMFNSGLNSFIYQNNSYINLDEKNISMNYVFVYSECGILTEYICYSNGIIGNKNTFYESGNRKSIVSYKNDIVNSISYYYDTDIQKDWISVYYFDETIKYYTVYYPSGYLRYHYNDGYLYEYEDEVTKTSYSDFLSKTEYTNEAAQAKLDELLGE